MNFSHRRQWLLQLAMVLWVAIASLLIAPRAGASMYDTHLPPELMSGPDLCAYAPCGEVMPSAQHFSKRKGSPTYVEAYADDNGKQRIVGYVFLSTDVVDIPAYSGKPVITLIGMDMKGIITGVRVLKHSEPILLAGIPESELTKFIAQYIGKSAAAKLEIGHGQSDDGAIGLDAISGATVTAIAENQVIAQSAYEIGKQVGIFKVTARPRAHFTALRENLNWAALEKEGSVQHLVVQASDIGSGDSGRPYMDLYFGYLNTPTLGISLLGERGYARLMQDLKQDEHAIFVIANGQVTFKGSGFVRGGIYDRVQVRQDTGTFTFRDTDYQNLYHLEPGDTPPYKESGIFIVRSANFNPAWPWKLTFLANKVDPDTRAKSFAHFDQEYWLPARYLEGGRPKVQRPQAAWKLAWESKTLEIALFVVFLAVTAGLYSQRDRLVRASKRKNKPWISIPRHLLWIVAVAYVGLYLKAQPSITQVMTWFHSLIHQWKWELFLSDPFIFIFWWFLIISVLVWGRGLFCGWMCPFGSLQHLTFKLGQLVGLKRFQGLLPKKLHDKLKWIKYGVFAVLLGVSFYSMEMAEHLAEIEPFKTTFLVGVWNRSWPFVLFVGAILGISLFSERPYCKYICPLGAGLAIPTTFRLFGLKRKKECQTCHACAAGCGSHAIDAQGKIDQRECLLCLDCMVMYYDDHACPPLVKERKSREKAGMPLTPIDGKGYFIPLDSVRRNLSEKAAELNKKAG
ncbi:4Fe-4S binding protein [Noviherbaspirillum autotrophicum]|uniref:Transcriptional regulator NosR n=1 Tax=Noviherbaspirillum autotrophicum TaxID=709839 RepID=A0A0C2C065_9BURK|nr:4Fe-4S binding protein [Noviherbaspirillum autotrophicum]KIF83696.1 transcriptional regulator NosR [Noviherbaspirillum autotrophicum]